MEANYFTVLYWFCHTSTWIHHGCTRVPHPEPPPHTIPLGHPSAPAPSFLYHALNLDWRFISQMILYKFQCHFPKSSRPCPIPQSKTVLYICVSSAASHTELFMHSKYYSFHLYQTLLYQNLTFLEKIQNLVAEAPSNFINKRVLLRILGFNQKSTLIWKQDDLWKSYQAIHEIDIPNLRVKITPWFFSKNWESGNIATSYIWKILVDCYSQSDVSLHSKRLPRWLTGKESACQCRRPMRCVFNPWVAKILWRRKWQITPVFFPGKFHGQRSLEGYNLWDRKESGTTEHTHSAWNTGA